MFPCFDHRSEPNHTQVKRDVNGAQAPCLYVSFINWN